MLAFLFNAVLYKNSPELYLSRAFISQGVDAKSLDINFDLNPKEAALFVAALQPLFGSWKGEAIHLKVNDSLAELLTNLSGANLGMKINGKQIKIKGNLKKINLDLNDVPGWEVSDFAPSDSWFYLQAAGLRQLLPEKLRELITSTRENLIIFPVETDLNLALITDIKDKKKYEDGLLNLQKESAALDTGAFKLTEGVVDGVKIFNFNNIHAPFTLGVIEDKLVLATGDEAFRKIIKTKAQQVDDLGHHSSFLRATQTLTTGADYFYYQPKMTDVTSVKNIDSLIDLKSPGFDSLKNFQDKISSIVLILGESLDVQGVINLK